MLEVNSFNNLLEILLKNIGDETCGHASYVADANKITDMLKEINLSTEAEPDLINFDNSDDNYFVIELDYELINGDNLLTYSIWPAIENEVFNTNYGLCLVDKDVPSSFESDYNKYGKDDKYYMKPIRVKFINEDLKKYDKPDLNASETTKIDTNDDGSISGFTKSWKNNNSYFSYSFHSTNEKNVLDLMDRLSVKI